MIAEREYEYEIGQRVEVTDGEDWSLATIAGRFIGPVSELPVYIFVECEAGRTDATYGADLRPVSA